MPRHRRAAPAQIEFADIGCGTLAGVGEARGSIGRYFGFYNGKRAHSSLGGKTPDQAYISMATPILAAA